MVSLKKIKFFFKEGCKSNCLHIIFVVVAVHSAILLMYTVSSSRDMYSNSDGVLMEAFLSNNVAPNQLGNNDQALYKGAWDLYKLGKFKEAESSIKSIENKILLSWLEYEKLMHKDTYSSYADLASFMENYPDHVLSYRVFNLAKKRKGSSNIKLNYPVSSRISIKDIDNLIADDVASYFKNFATENSVSLQKNPITTFRRGFKYSASARKSSDKLKSYIFDSRHLEAFNFFKKISLKEKDSLPEILWWGGLTAFRMGDMQMANNSFAKLAKAIEGKDPLDANLAMVYFWLARSYQEMGDIDQQTIALKKAQSFKFNYYGQIASGILGNNDLLPDRAWFKIRIPEYIFENNAIKRVIALTEIGQYTMADVELAGFINERKVMNPKVLLTISSFADELRLPMTAYKAADKLFREHGWFYASGMFPRPWWFDDDESVVSLQLLAMARRESRFEPNLKSNKGARGVLQVMPATAIFMDNESTNKEVYSKIRNIDYNISVAEKYFSYLLEPKMLDGNLLQAVAAYNAGPGAVKRWQAIQKDEDPLLFAETFPYRETRDYMYHVLSNTFVYLDRLNFDNKSLQEFFMQGKFPEVATAKSKGQTTQDYFYAISGSK